MTSTSSKVAIVTGGVSGIGEQLTRTLISRGWVVIALDIERQTHLGETLSAELGEPFEFLVCDVTKYQQLADSFSKIFEKRGRIDAFCSNAGLVDHSSIYTFASRGQTSVPPEPDLSSTDICFKGLIYGTQLSIHFMRQNPTPGGFIIATSSICGIYPLASFPEYCGAKAAVCHFVRTTAPVLKLHENITINTVCPGVVPTIHINQDMRETIGFEYLTPISTVVAGYLRFLDDPSLTGEVVEASVDKILPVPELDYVNGEVSKRTASIYDPFFKYIHGQFSGLPNVVQRRT